MKSFVFACLCCAILVGCSSSSTTTTTTKPTPSPSSIAASQNAYQPVVLAKDTVMAQATAGGLTYVAAPKAKTPPRTESLQDIGDEIVMKYGESVLIVIDSLNPTAVTVESIVDEASKTVTLRVVDKDKDVVMLTHKCQTVDRIGGGATAFPKISIADGLALEQVVVTPMCDDKNRLAGYSIRYGAEERGCSVQAQAGLKSFHRCFDKIAPEKKQTAKAASSVKNDTWRLLFYGDERK